MGSDLRTYQMNDSTVNLEVNALTLKEILLFRFLVDDDCHSTIDCIFAGGIGCFAPLAQ